MPITVTCGQCQQPLSVKDEYAGKRGKCPKCQAVIPIPARGASRESRSVPAPPPAVRPASTAANSAAPPPVMASKSPSPWRGDLRSQIFSGFQSTSIERVGTPPLYQLGILLTTLLMVLLPLLYVAIIGLVCVVVWWHLTHNYVIIGAVRGKAALMAIVIYVAPLVIGAIVIVFMFKPLFARPAKEERRRSLTPQSDPLLFDFVERICDLVGAARPRRIDIDCNVNASASFRRGWLSLLSGGDLVLTIGMPLAAGLSLQQFAGVLAHEFGHFSQGAGMRLTYIIRSINFWFIRVVYERDAWDAWLENVSGSVDIRVGWVIYVARGCVWLTRRILWVLMYVGHLVAGFMLRQMEFDADKYETRVAGSDSFAVTSRQLRLLSLAWRGAEHDLASFHRDGRLVDNMPRLLMSNLQQLPQEAHDVVNRLTAESTSGLFDTHPADKDRIAAAAAEQAAGVFRSNLPASALFSSFDAAAKGVTWDYYCAIFGKLVDPKSLHSTEELLARSEGEQAAAKACDRFFAAGFTVLRPLRLPVMQGQHTQHPSIWQEELAQSRGAMQALAADYRQALATFDKADTRLVQSRQAQSVLSTGTALQHDKFETAYPSAAEASRQRDAAQLEISRLGNRLEAFDDAAGRRLRADLMLLFAPATAARAKGAEQMQRDCRQLLPIVSQVSSLHASIMELRSDNATLVALLGHIGNDRNEALVREILNHAGRVRRQMGELYDAFARTDYPLDHASGPMTVSQYLIKIIPQLEDVGGIFQAADEMLGKLLELYARAIGRLCLIAEAVEADQGLAPLPAPEGAAP